MKMYCVKCQEKVEARNPHQVRMKNGRKAIKARCSQCNTKMYQITG